MHGHLNLFVPYERSGASHENQLTRALLIVLRYSPMAHEAWLRMISQEHSIQNLPIAMFATQRQRIVSDDSAIPEGEKVPGISVWLAPDAQSVEASIEPSDRLQILDGIVTYGSELIVVIENKITWTGVTEQPHRLNLHGSPVQFSGQPKPVTWQHLLSVLSGLIERKLVTGAEELLIDDFLEFVEQNFPSIGPYTTLMKCGDIAFRIERRLDALMGEVTGTADGKSLGWRDLPGIATVFMAKLAFVNGEVRLQLYPADTLGQSRAFYEDLSVVREVLALQADGWRLSTNFHWGFMAAGYAWMDTPLPVKDYCEYWIREIGKTHELTRDEWEPYWTHLVSAQIVEVSAKSEFDTYFTASKRQRAHPRPGICCEYTWPLAEAKILDARGKLEEQVRARLNQILCALNADLLSGRGP